MISPISADQKSLIDKVIEEHQTNRRLEAEVSRLTKQCNAMGEAMNAVITAFFRDGAKAPNVTADCWGEQTYRIINNGSFCTIARSDAEVRREADGEWILPKHKKSRRRGYIRRYVPSK